MDEVVWGYFLAGIPVVDGDTESTPGDSMQSLRSLLTLEIHDGPTEAASLHRHYPSSSVLWASPRPHTARPGSRELPVDPDYESPLRLPVLRPVLLCIRTIAIIRQD